MTLALVIFALAALGGVTMAVLRFQGRPQPPLALALVHGAAAAAGLITLIVLVAGNEAPSQAKLALGLFLGAALGGFALFAIHLRKGTLPIWLILVHALVAVSGFLVLLTAALS
jgi:hypothetical protein